jgi:lipopolysaccharide export system protein LptA
MAYLKKNVVIIDGNNQLQSDDVNYNTITKIAKYTKGATLQSDNTQLTSNEGVYNGKTKDAYFKGDVVVTDAKYNVDSKEMKYNTVTKFVTFLDESTIVTENTTIQGKKGTYDAAKEIGNFNTRSTVSNDEQDITANTMHYEKKTGISNATGNVVMNDYKNNRQLLANKTNYNEQTGYMKAFGDVIMYDEKEGRTMFTETVEYYKKSKYTVATKNVLLYDSAQNSILQCNQLQFNQYLHLTLATGNPILRTLADKDSLFMRADSFFSAPANGVDTIKKFVVPNVNPIDSNEVVNDSLHITLLGLGHVIIFSDSMQAICDSMSYSQNDSIFKLFKKPILWTRANQAIGDTIWLRTVNNKLSQLNLLSNASMISDTKHTNMYDQIYGDKIDGYIVNEALDNMFVDGSAESIYYNKNDNDEYIGMNKTKSAQIRIVMKERKVNRISFYSLPEGGLIPMDKIAEADKKGAAFVWLEDKRPKTKYVVVGGEKEAVGSRESADGSQQSEGSKKKTAAKKKKNKPKTRK